MKTDLSLKQFICTLTFALLQLTYATSLSEISQKELLMPPPPSVQAKNYIIIDAETGAVIAEKNAHTQISPASLTKLMTSYVIFHALSQNHVSLEDDVYISTQAWKTEGSRMFLSEHSKVNLEKLLKGVIVTSANDASVALSEHYAGSEESFYAIMNRMAQNFGLKNTQFSSSTGLDKKNHYSSAADIAKLSSRIIQDFPEYFHWFQEEEVKHADITQSNRNQLMLKHDDIDGLKTGYTKQAGYCLATTAKRGNTRLIIVTANSPSAQARDRDTLALLNYAFRFFETTLVYPKDTQITTQKVYKGVLKEAHLTTHKPLWVTIPKGTTEQLLIDVEATKLIAPLDASTPSAQLVTKINNQVIATAPLYPHTTIQESTGIHRLIDQLKLMVGL
ncbi:D-alanyl-D-alanine carboxypeptidase [Candidatus Comchoanobacter bicostacola]|uniref:serine-type D-Ala-D-Ala carboxypeptidase n=1 Tax=Candidatus Comchoanobacter bicostacola TaxID=2919598 RepID=A0ABY5DK03_9GAMM|nr:D-alanyl-D-alanine carboxypeptidase family protein [Candidatus Comchoanobacter bicostacola]UTC24810.1 D-alanyl-D-alanine carboxypeptidase [Candidatus Comchoanobacter bicostacola]